MAEKQCNLLKNGGGIEQVESTSFKDVNNNDQFIYKLGHMVSIRIIGSYSVGAGTYPVIATIPAGYRPTRTEYFGINNNMAGTGNTLISINTNGKMSVNGYLSSGSVTLQQTMTYIVE